MKRVLLLAALTAAISLTAVGGAFAGTQDGALFTLHSKAYTSKAAIVCTTWKPTTVACSNYNVQWGLNLNTYVYLTVAHAQQAPGIAGLSCGVLYPPEIGCFGWTLCADLQYPNAGVNGDWPASGGGNRITWSALDACQRTIIGTDGVHAIAGAFYLYAYGDGVFEITHNNNLVIPELAVADCAASTTFLDAFPNEDELPKVGFGTGVGCNPCTMDCSPIIATQPTTWGKVKTQF